MPKTSATSVYLTKSEVNKFKKAADKYASRATVSVKAANAALVDLGIYTKSGSLSKSYSHKPNKHKK